MWKWRGVRYRARGTAVSWGRGPGAGGLRGAKGRVSPGAEERPEDRAENRAETRAERRAGLLLSPSGEIGVPRSEQCVES